VPLLALTTANILYTLTIVHTYIHSKPQPAFTHKWAGVPASIFGCDSIWLLTKRGLAIGGRQRTF
jgi:hypothetical protein